MNLQENIRRILREEMNQEVKWLIRRLETTDIQQDLFLTVYGTRDFISPCKYKTSEEYCNDVIQSSTANFINHWEELYETDNPLPIAKFVYNLISERYGDDIRDRYNKRNC